MPNLILFVMLPIISGLILYLFKKFIPKWVCLFVQFFLLALSVYFVVQTNYDYLLVPLIQVPLPYGMALQIDQLSSIMLLLNNFLFFNMILYSYKKSFMEHLFVFLFLSLQGLINGLFLSTDFFNIYILVEVATITASILIMYKKDSQSMYDGMIYLIANMIAMTFFLFGVGFLYKYYGVLDFFSLHDKIQADLFKEKLYLPFSFLMTGIALKAALMPLYSWLPKAHGTASAPSIVSAILSGIFVKTGIYLLLRLQFIFGGVIETQTLLLFIGFLTAISGFIFAVSQTDIKLILAYHTVSQVGLILIGVSGHNHLNVLGGIYHILSHGIFKALLFLVAGLLIEKYQTRKIADMHGLFYLNRTLSFVLIVAVLSITGAPFFSGGYSKYFISKGYDHWLYTFLFWLINLGTMVSFIKFFMLIFSKPDPWIRKFKLKVNEGLVLLVMASACIFLGTFGNLAVEMLFDVPMKLSLAAQINKFIPYISTYAVAVLLYFFYIKHSKLLVRIKKIELTFNSISFAIAIFFLFTLTYLNVTHS